MRILFIGDYSNVHTTLAHELRKMGHHVDIMSDRGGHMNLYTDIYIKREPGFKGGVKYLFELFNLLPGLKDYDVVQLINTNFFSLKPAKIKYFFDRIKEQNKSVFLTLAGDDYYYVKACFDAKLFRFSEFKVGKELTEASKSNPAHMYGWISHSNKKLAEHLVENLTGAISVLPEYDMAGKPIFGERLAFSNLPINFSELPQTSNERNDKIRIMVAMRTAMAQWKGTKILAAIAEEIKKEMPDKVEVEVVKDVSLNEFFRKISESDIVLDQLYAYSPAMTALYTMAMGKVAASGAQPEYYQYIGNPEERPVFSLSPLDSDIKDRLIELINDKDRIITLGRQSKELVKKHNDSKIVTGKFLNHWQNLI